MQTNSVYRMKSIIFYSSFTAQNDINKGVNKPLKFMTSCHDDKDLNIFTKIMPLYLRRSLSNNGFLNSFDG